MADFLDALTELVGDLLLLLACTALLGAVAITLGVLMAKFLMWLDRR